MSNPQPLVALKTANTIRIAKAQAIRSLRTGELSIYDAITDQTDALAKVMLPDLLLAAPFFGREKLRHVGRRAVRDNVNLLTTLGAASQRTREWLATDLAQHVWERRAQS